MPAMSVIDDIERGILRVVIKPGNKNVPITYQQARQYEPEILRLAKIGATRQWVSVAEGLPEEDQLVLVANGKWVNLRHFCDNTWFNCLSGEGFELNEYTYWQPLPPLPEGVE